MNQRLVQKEATRRLILQAARALFGARGYSRVEVRLLAMEIKRSTGAVYAHFPSKAELWRAAMGSAAPEPAAVARALAAQIERVIVASVDPLADLGVLRDQLRDFAERWSGPA